MDNSTPAIDCWACKVKIAVPFLHDKPANTFKCGWCGALNELQQDFLFELQQWQHRHSPHGPLAPGNDGGTMQAVHAHSSDVQTATAPGAFALHLPSAQQLIHRHSTCSSRLKLYKCFMQCFYTVCQQTWRWAIVVFVVLLVGSIAGTGIWLLLPRLCTTWATYLPNLLFAALLLLNVACNYTAAVVQSPGKVSELVPLPPRGASGEVLQGSFYLYTYCKPCKSPKPPQAHHCRSCGHCVVDMDHHCPFIANCVGCGNLRPFLLFLFWTLIAAAYTLVMCSILVWQQWEVVRSSVSLHAALHNSSSSRGGRAADAAIAPGAAAVLANATDALHIGAAGMSSIGVISDYGRRTLDMPAAAPVAAAAGGPSQWPTGWLIASTGLFFVVLQLAPGWLLATYYLAAASAALLLAIGVLLYSQLSYLARGVTYIQHLKGGTAAGPAEGAYGPSQCEQQHVCAVSSADGGTNLQLAQSGKHSMLWLRIREVLGADSTVSSCLQAALLPRWRARTTLSPAGPKKWT